MAFVLTKFIYPIETPILLSDKFDYYLDNPRTDFEIELIENFIDRLFEKGGNIELIPNMGYSIRYTFKQIIDYFSLNGIENYEFNFFKSREKVSEARILAESWIILRFYEEENFNELNKDDFVLYRRVMSDIKDEFKNAFHNLLNYSYVYTFINEGLSQTVDNTFILDEYPYQSLLKYNDLKLMKVIDKFIYSFSLEDDSFINYWFLEKEEFIETAIKLDGLLNKEKSLPLKFNKKDIPPSQQESPSEKILHIGSYLKIAVNEDNNIQMTLIMLVALLEYLLTRNPDTNKFNVEESITKQFRLKCACAVNKQDSKINLRNLAKILSDIYKQRSNFAHGNIDSKYTLEDISSSLKELNKIVKDIINLYIEDREYIDFLKDN